MARRYGQKVKVKRVKINSMKLKEVKERLVEYKKFENSKYYQHLQDRYSVLVINTTNKGVK